MWFNLPEADFFLLEVSKKNFFSSFYQFLVPLNFMHLTLFVLVCFNLCLLIQYKAKFKIKFLIKDISQNVFSSSSFYCVIAHRCIRIRVFTPKYFSDGALYGEILLVTNLGSRIINFSISSPCLGL